MKYIKYLLSILIFFICLNVKAIDACTTDEMNRLKELANNIELKYKYEVTNEYKAANSDENDFVEGGFQIEILNYSDDLKYVLKYDDTEFQVDVNELKEMHFDGGTNLALYIYSYTANMCTHSLLRTYNLKLPYYNQYYHYNKDKCEKASDFKYCKEFITWYDEKTNKEIDKEYEQFLKNGEVGAVIKNNNMLVIASIIMVLILSIGGFFVYKQIKRRKKDDL